MLIHTELLTKRYRTVTALDRCTLSVRSGEVFGLLGPNGAGKTTLLRLLMGFLRPTSGQARIGGKDCQQETLAVRQRVSYLPGDARLFRQMRGHEVLQFFTTVRRDCDLSRAEMLADRLDLDTSRKVALMSTGMRQKLALTAVFAAETPVLILDEPTANLDPTVRGTIVELVSEMRDVGRTVVFSSHVLSEVETVCDRVAILRRGQVVHLQDMADLRQQHRIRAHLSGVLPPAPAELRDHLQIHVEEAGVVVMETTHELSSLLGWLATLSLREVRIEPVGLRAVYDQFHSNTPAETPA